MPRRIRDFSLQSTDGKTLAGGAADEYLDKVVKYVPADIIAAWTAAVAVIKAAGGIPHVAVLLICFVIGLGLTYWWMLKTTTSPGQPRAVKQAGVAVVAFAVWVLALGDLNDALAVIPGWNVAYAKLILILFTLVSGII
jgi:hypothetical protein